MSRKRTREQNAKAVERAESARTAFDDGVMGEAFRFVESSALNRVRTAKTPGESYDATITVQVLDQVRRVLKAFVADGERAAADMEKEFTAERERRDFEMRHANYLIAARDARSEADGLTTATREGKPNA